MFNFINHVTAVFKVGCDKTFDYISYYAIPMFESDTPLEDDSQQLLLMSDIQQEMLDTIKKDIHEKKDSIEDYADIIKVENLTDEKSNKRIFRSEGFFREYTSFFSKPTHVIDNIYLGSAFNAASYYDLKELNIITLINATKEISHYYPEDFTYFNYDIYDNNKDSICEHLEEAFQSIINQQENEDGNILIHCYMGSSRSASLVLYYLMKKGLNNQGEPMSHEEALNFLKEKRPIINPTFRLTKDLAKSIMIR
jgi:protein-tyrosine phosphatase